MYIDKLLIDLYFQFSLVPDHRSPLNTKLPLPDILMSCFAVFSLKDSSLLLFVQRYKLRKDNLRKVYGIKVCPSDTAMRQVIDEVQPSTLQLLPGRYIQMLDNSGRLAAFELKGEGLDGKLLISIDGTQYYTSSKIHCGSCLCKKHRDGTSSYHHNALTSVIVHPDRKEVLVTGVEDIQVQDGNAKNDHELAAAKRLLPLICSAIGHRQAIICADALYATGPFIRAVQGAGKNFIISIKEGNQGFPFLQFRNYQLDKKTVKWEARDRNYEYTYEFANGLILNGQNQDIIVNFMFFQQKNIKTNKLTTMTWVTDIPITVRNGASIVKAGRARWKIENETFNTLKNQNYNFEHNFGHGKKYLAQNFVQIMFLAFLIDQIQQLCSALFQKAFSICVSKKSLWESMRQVFDLIPVENMKTLFEIITKDIKIKIELSP